VKGAAERIKEQLLWLCRLACPIGNPTIMYMGQLATGTFSYVMTLVISVLLPIPLRQTP
jgi:hypothetical protein